MPMSPSPKITANQCRNKNPHPSRHLRIRVDPSPGEIDNEPFGIVTALEAIRQASDAVRAALAIGLPSDLRTRAPLLVGLV